MKKLLFSVLSLSMVGLLATGCGLLGPEEDEDEVSITISTIGNVQAGQAKEVDGTIDANVELESVTYTILDSDGNEATKVSTSALTSVGETKVDLMDDAQLKITSQATACNGEYQLKIEATAGSATTTKTASFTIVQGSDCEGTAVSERSAVTIGAQSAAQGSALDADAWQVYSSAGATAAQQSATDIVVGFATSAVRMYSPAAAKSAGFIPNWTNPPTTGITKYSGDYSAITTKEEIQQAYGTGGTNVAVSADDVVIVETTEGAHVMIKVNSVSSSDASASVTVVAKY